MECILRDLTVSAGPQHFKYYIFILLLLPGRQVLLPLPGALFETLCNIYSKNAQEKHPSTKIKTYLFSAYSLPHTDFKEGL